jgi:hypothetical protein
MVKLLFRSVIAATMLALLPLQQSLAQQRWIADTVRKTAENREIEKMRNASPDMGSWIGMRAGVQTNGGDVGERWAVTGMYEWRFTKVLSLPVEFSWFKHRVQGYADRGNYLEFYKDFEERPIISVGLKIRMNFWKGNIYLQGGTEYMSGSGFYMIMPYYAGGVEVFFTEKFSLYSNIHKNIVPDYKHFVTIGTNLMIDSVIR